MQHLIEIERLWPRRLRIAEREQLMRQHRRAPAGLEDLVQIRPHLVRHALLRAEQLGVAEHAGQQVVEMMRDARGQIPDGFERVRPQPLFLHPQPRGHVLDDHFDRGHDFARAVHDARAEPRLQRRAVMPLPVHLDVGEVAFAQQLVDSGRAVGGVDVQADGVLQRDDVRRRLISRASPRARGSHRGTSHPSSSGKSRWTRPGRAIDTRLPIRAAALPRLSVS